MFELTISNEKSKVPYMDFIYQKLRTHVDNSKGLIIFEEMDDRLLISLAVPEKQKDFYKAFVLELVSEIMVMDYKYKYIKDHLKSTISNEALWAGFVRALTVFDKQTDKDLIKKNLIIGEELLIDSSYHFKMFEVKNRWKEIVELVEENLSGLLARDSFIDLMKFLIVASEPEADVVYVKNCKNVPEIMINDDKKAVNLCFFDENVNNETRIISELVCLCPRQIRLELDEKDEKLTQYIVNIFEGKCSKNMDTKSEIKYSKNVDNGKNVVYNNLQ